jgi:hypothetical protein
MDTNQDKDQPVTAPGEPRRRWKIRPHWRRLRDGRVVWVKGWLVEAAPPEGEVAP